MAQNFDWAGRNKQRVNLQHFIGFLSTFITVASHCAETVRLRPIVFSGDKSRYLPSAVDGSIIGTIMAEANRVPMFHVLPHSSAKRLSVDDAISGSSMNFHLRRTAVWPVKQTNLFQSRTTTTQVGIEQEYGQTASVFAVNLKITSEFAKIALCIRPNPVSSPFLHTAKNPPVTGLTQ